MAIETENGWLTNLERQAGIRRGLVVHGNLLDVCFSKETNDYRSIIDVITGSLKKRGFDHVVLWDRFSGMHNIKSDIQETLVGEATNTSCLNPQGGSDYDIGSDAPVPGNARNDSKIPPNAEDFLAVVHYHMLNPKRTRYAFVLDWSQYLFGNPNALSEQERQWLLILSKAIRNAPFRLDDAEGLTRPTNLVVLVCTKLGGIPPSLYQGNPAVQEQLVPPPSRVEREAFVKRTIDKWKLRNPLRPGEAAFNDFIDSLEGLSLRDLQQLVKLSRQVGEESITADRLINLYKYGEQKSPWEDLNRAKLATIKESLTKRVKGQDDAVQKVSDVIIRAYTGLSGLQHSKKQKMPKGILFFVGPTGVGKTELAKSLAQFLFGDEEACIRFDMSEFNHEHSDQRLVGAPPGYVGYEEGGQLTNAVKRRPFSVLLFDEIEKAHVRILDKFLQILEDGRLTDGKGETVYFSETIIIFTSNIGAAEIAFTDDTQSLKNQFLAEVRHHFVDIAKRPELLNRIGDNVVPFNFIVGHAFLIAIARAKLVPLKERLKEKYKIAGLVFDDEEKALRAIAEKVDRQMGGRAVLNEIVKCIIDPLAHFLFEEEEDSSFYAGRTIKVHQAGSDANFVFELE